MSETKHTPGPWSTGYVIRTNATSKWSAKEIAEDNDIENRTVFTNFSSSDQGRSRKRICFCETKEDATFIASAPALLERNQQLEQQTKTLRETLQSIQRHGLIEKDGYESVLQSLHASLALTDPTLKQKDNGN